MDGVYSRGLFRGGNPAKSRYSQQQQNGYFIYLSVATIRQVVSSSRCHNHSELHYKEKRWPLFTRYIGLEGRRGGGWSARYEERSECHGIESATAQTKKQRCELTSDALYYCCCCVVCVIIHNLFWTLACTIRHIHI